MPSMSLVVVSRYCLPAVFLFDHNRDDVSLRLGRGAGGVLDSVRAGAAPALINALDQARSSIRVAIYSITSRSIVDALVAAKRRGVDVAVKTDKSESEQRNQAAMIAQLQTG